MKSLVPSIKDVSVWIALFLGLYLLTAALISSSTDSNSKLDLLKLPSQFIYGHKIADDTKLSFNLDEYGETALFFQSSNIQADQLDSLQLQIEGLNENYQVDLVWKNFDNQESHEQQLLQPNGNVQINLIINNPNWGSAIEQIGLRFSPQQHLGITLADDEIVTIKQLNFKPISLLDSIHLIKDYWMEYDAWSYKSINHNRVNKLLPIYAQPSIFIATWVLIGLILNFFLGKKKSHLGLIVIAWLILDILFISDMQSRSDWAQQYYSDSRNKVLPDDNLNQIAKQVKSLLNLDSKSNKNKNIKILILSTNRYQRARLIYHMLPVNSSFLDLSAESSKESKVNKGDYILSFDALRNPRRAVFGKLKFNENSLSVKEVATSAEYSLMKVLND